MSENRPFLPSLLQTDFELRKLRNPAYSLRAYARDLKLSSSTLHSLFTGDGIISAPTLTRLSKYFKFSEGEKAHVRSLNLAARAKKPERREQHLEDANSSETRFNSLTEEEFESAGGWHAFAVMELLQIRNAPGDAEAIAATLRLSLAEVKHVLAALTKLKVIAVNAGAIRVLKTSIILPSGPPLRRARDAHREIMERALEAIETQPKGTRNFSTLILKFRKKDIAEADEFIRKFRRAFSRKFEAGTDHDSVYSLGVQLARLDGNS